MIYHSVYCKKNHVRTKTIEMFVYINKSSWQKSNSKILTLADIETGKSVQEIHSLQNQRNDQILRKTTIKFQTVIGLIASLKMQFPARDVAIQIR